MDLAPCGEQFQWLGKPQAVRVDNRPFRVKQRLAQIAHLAEAYLRLLRKLRDSPCSMRLGKQLAASGKLEPLVAAWSADGLGLAIGLVWLIKELRR